mmetsp:Transcript_36371/g.63773  ORF Transcript_36371/g.63773 Transcript_36371/m.63773 type:complete len:611 (-) Transcript_36371:126-1958(-)
MTILHQPHRHRHDDPTLPCGYGSCRKRHARSNENAPRRDTSGIKISPRRHTIVSIAALAVAAMAMTHCLIPEAAAAIAVPIERKGVSLTGGSFAKVADDWGATSGRHQFKMKRRLQAAANTTDAAAAEEEDDHEDEGHDDHDHDLEDELAHEDEATAEEDVNLFEDANGDVVAAAEEDHDDHDGHDDHDDHDDHGDEEFESFSSSNENVEEKLPWGAVIGASLLVNLAALSGCLIVVMTAVHKGVLKARGEDASDVAVGHGKLFDICIPAFAVGALIATAVFLIFPEALHLIEGAHAGESDNGEEGDMTEDHSGHGHRYLQEDSHEGHDDDSSESVNAAKFGCAILGGFLLPLVFSIIFHHSENDETMSVIEADEDCETCNERDIQGTDIETSVSVPSNPADDSFADFCEFAGAAKPNSAIIQKIEEDSPQDEGEHAPEQAVESRQESVPLVTKTVVNRQLCASILLGDAFHNFADGIFIGAAFKSCSTGTAISIVLVTLFHEIAQELADFVLLTRYAGLSIIKACVLNFISGLTVCLGGIVFLAGNPSDEATGIILAMAGGVYFNIAACETLPRLENIVKGRGDRVWVLFSVIVGTLPIGLILLNHQHC